MEIPVHPETNSLTVARDTAIRPVTIRQVLSAKIQSPDADFKIDGNLVRTVGVIANVLQVTHVSVAEHIRRDRYVLDDGTSRGLITASHTLPIEEPLLDPPPDYAHVIGTLFHIRGTNFIRVGRIRAVKDSHQLYFHFLEAMTVTAAFKKGVYPTTRITERVDMPPQILSPVVNEQPVETTTTLLGQATQAEPSIPVDHSDINNSEDEVSSNASGGTFQTAASHPEDFDESCIISSLSALNMEETALGGGTDSKQHRSLIGRDPYSHLSPLQRDILLQLFHTADQPGSERLHVTLIKDSIRPSLWSEPEEIGEALDDLVKQQYIDADSHFLYYWLKPLGWNYML